MDGPDWAGIVLAGAPGAGKRTTVEVARTRGAAGRGRTDRDLARAAERFALAIRTDLLPVGTVAQLVHRAAG